jgi:hypothetical protein
MVSAMGTHARCCNGVIRVSSAGEGINYEISFDPDNDCTCTYQSAGITELHFSGFIIPVSRPLVKFVSKYPIMTTDEKRELTKAITCVNGKIQPKFFVIINDFFTTKDLDKIAKPDFKEHVEEVIDLNILPNDLQGGPTLKKLHAQETSQRPARSAGAIF